MRKTVPLSDLLRQTSEVTSMLADGDLILARRDADDLYLSTRDRHEREARGLQVTARMLAKVAAADPELAANALLDVLPWTRWLPPGDRHDCLTQLVLDLSAGAETGEFRPFQLSLAAWESTAIAWADPDVAEALAAARGPKGRFARRPVVPRPGE
jgi:hypothetical protein